MNKLAKIEVTELDKTIQNAGLAIQEGEDIKKSYQPFLNQLAEIQAQAEGINFDAPEFKDEQLARELRLKTVKIRTGSSDLKDSRKKGYLLKGNLEQAAYNLIAASCKLAEDALSNVEKAREIAEAKRVQELETERRAILWEFTEIIPQELGKMPQDVFDNYLTGIKIAYQAKKDAEVKAEADRLAKIEAERIENERIRQENERLQKEAEEREWILKIQEKERAELKAKQDAENERERQHQAKLLADAKAKADKEKKALEDKAKKEREAAAEALRIEQEKADEILLKERAKAKKLADELKAKEDAEKKEKAAKLAEEKARIEAEKKAAKAPDKEKLTKWIDSLSMPELALTTDSKVTANVIGQKLEAFKVWAKDQIENI